MHFWDKDKMPLEERVRVLCRYLWLAETLSFDELAYGIAERTEDFCNGKEEACGDALTVARRLFPEFFYMPSDDPEGPCYNPDLCEWCDTPQDCVSCAEAEPAFRVPVYDVIPPVHENLDLSDYMRGGAHEN